MKKILIICFCLISLFSGSTIADEQINDITFDYFYEYMPESSSYQFKPLSKEDYKSLPGDAKKWYKQVVKADKLWDKGIKYSKNDWHRFKYFEKAFNLNPTLYPIAISLGYYYYLDKKNFNNAEYYFINVPVSYFKIRDLVLAMLYADLHKYSDSVNSAQKFLKLDDLNEKDIIDAKWVIITSYKNLNRYDEALPYANELLYKYKNVQNICKFDAWMTRYYYYHQKKDYKTALEAARKMLELEKNYDNYMRVAGLTNKDESLKLYYQARWNAQNTQQKNEVMGKIARLEQDKIDNAVKKLKVYVKKPDWFEIVQNAKYGNTDYWYNRQDKFFKAANDCINTQSGNNLVACFNQLNSEQDRLTQQLNDDVYRAQQLAIQQESVRQQQIQNYYNSQSVYWQQQNYYLNDRMRRYVQYGY